MTIPSDEAIIISRLVELQFLPELMDEFEKFLEVYRERIAWETDYKRITGYTGRLMLPNPPEIDIRNAEDKLIKNIQYAIDKIIQKKEQDREIQRQKLLELPRHTSPSKTSRLLRLWELSKKNFFT